MALQWVQRYYDPSSGWIDKYTDDLTGQSVFQAAPYDPSQSPAVNYAGAELTPQQQAAWSAAGQTNRLPSTNPYNYTTLGQPDSSGIEIAKLLATSIPPPQYGSTPAPSPYQFPFLPNYQEFAMRQPGYVPGSGTYNQWRLDRPGLFSPTGYNLQTGSGGPGDPNTGSEPQTAVDWRTGTPLFVKTDPSKNLPDEYINVVNNFLRSDAGGSGLGSAQPTAQDYASLQQAMAAGLLQPTARGQQYLGSAGHPYSGALAPPPGGGAAGAAGTGGLSVEDQYWQNRAAIESADQAARLTYNNWVMSTGNDKLAMEKAQQAWSNAFAEESRRIGVEQWQKNFALSEAGVTGMYGGQKTAAQQNAENAQATSLLGMAANLRGPSNYLSYLRTLGNTPEGLKSLVGGLAGQYQFAFSPGQTPGATYERQSLGTITRDLNGAPAGGMRVGQDGTVQAGGNDASGVNLPGGSQWNARNTAILQRNPTQWGLLGNLYEESGRDFNQEYANFLNSLPRYGGPQRAQVSWA